MNPIANAAPKAGEKWRGNFYRIDYDSETAVLLLAKNRWQLSRINQVRHAGVRIAEVL